MPLLRSKKNGISNCLLGYQAEFFFSLKDAYSLSVSYCCPCLSFAAFFIVWCWGQRAHTVTITLRLAVSLITHTVFGTFSFAFILFGVDLGNLLFTLAQCLLIATIVWWWWMWRWWMCVVAIVVSHGNQHYTITTISGYRTCWKTKKCVQQ